ncbi:hypothetical protein LTR15_005683 [Elasticomyces elasticus]|nr:hypothetical protein LTR15_005683 [Elasticomyces elasticus]
MDLLTESAKVIPYGQDPTKYLSDQYGGRPLTTNKPGPEHRIYRAPHDVLGCVPDCHVCSKHYRPTVEQVIDSRVYEGDLDDLTAQLIAYTHTEAIAQDRKYLQQVIEKHGNAILNRWTKKNENQRQELVRAAIPELFEKKIPQAHIFYAPGHLEWRPRRRYRKTYLLPYLTIENLCDTKLKLPSLLHNRALRTPDEWVMFDSEQFRDAYTRGNLSLKYNPHCVVMYGDSYGKLVRYNREKAHSYSIVGWPRAQLILEAQADLLGHLRKITEKLLEDCTVESGCAKWTKTIEGGLKSPGSQEMWASFGVQPFQEPPSFDPAAMLELAQNQQAVAEDELWLLQTDLSYAHSRVSNLRKLDFFGFVGETPEAEASWKFVAAEIINVASNRAMMWRWITQELRYISALQAPISSDQPVPPDYGLTIGSFYRLVKNFISQRLEYSKTWLASYPGIQEHYEIIQDPKIGRALRLKRIDGKVPTHAHMFRNDLFYWVIYQLHHTDRRYSVDTDMSFQLGVFDDWYAAASKDEKAKVDPRLYATLTDLAGMQRILSSLRCHRPFCTPVDAETAKRTQSDRDDTLVTWRDCRGAHAEPKKGWLERAGALLKVFFDVGLPKGVRDELWLAKADESRAALQAFWDAMHANWSDVTLSMDRSRAEIEYSLDMLQQGLHPRHLAEVQKERAAILERCRPSRVSSVEPVLPDWAANSSLPARPASFKKAGAQGIPVVQDTVDVSIAEEIAKVKIADPSTDLKLVVTVNKESLKFFDMMFGVTGHTGTVRWQRFVSAMVDAGCAAISNGGSAVTFKHSSGSIAFHRPHPEDEIVPDLLRIMGKRLKKRLGWSIEVFLERSKDATNAQ